MTDEQWVDDLREGVAENFRALVRRRTGRDFDDPQEAYWALVLADATNWQL